jgi:hypothetical protein
MSEDRSTTLKFNIICNLGSRKLPWNNHKSKINNK